MSADDQPEPIVESMPPASNEPVSTVTPPLVGSIPGLEHKSYRVRFAAVYAALALVLVGAVVFFAIVVAGGASPKGQPWSTWKPKGGDRLAQASEIASYVAPKYRLAPGGDQLVTVQAHNPEIQNVPVEDVALKGGEDYKVVSTKDALVYVLCGLGPRCSITKGTPSVERARLLRREALELALYTFKYVDGVASVIALIPPPANDPRTNWALFFQKRNFHKELSRPLAETLPSPPPGQKLVPQSVVGNQDERTVEKLTRPYWFTSQFQQLQDGNAILVLDPVIVAR